MVKNKYIRRFLAIEQSKELIAAFKAQDKVDLKGKLGRSEMILAIAVAMIPALTLELGKRLGAMHIGVVGIALAVLLSFWLRHEYKIKYKYVQSWKKSFRVTHTAFAAGCIPLLIVFLIDRDLLYTVEDLKYVTGSQTIPFNPFHRVIFVLKVALWAGITEEVIYRGMLLSILRRVHYFKTQSARNWFAIFVSSIIFACGHVPGWGLGMLFPVLCLGTGLGIAYVALGEKLLPLIVYHIIFDILSIVCYLLGLKFE